ncbi:alcohol oxidase [Russula brevipes]|nr:alcohol oxidase [Russula brevipes]
MLATIDQVSDKSFDYIIIGLVVATRLSEDPSVSVLVLEAGPPNLNDPAILIPGTYETLLGNGQYDWGFSTVPQVNANGRSIYWPRGKGLGGSSLINFFQFHRPSATDIDAFEKLGNKGWNWETLKKYCTKVEQFHLPEMKDDTMRFDTREHGLEGPLEVGYPTLLSGYEKPFVEAIQSLGINLASEPFAGDTTGIWSTPLTISPRTRTRSYSANVYYKPHASRNNLTVLTSAHVARVSLEKLASGGAMAKSVSFLHEGNEYLALVKREVIVSAGTVMSPQILELSGIGDADVLRKAGVEVVVDLPGVGNNVQEHYYVGVSYQVKEELESNYLTFDCLRDPDELRKQTELYHSGEKGIFDIKSSLMTFVPLSAISPDAQTLQEKYLASIRARIDIGDCPPGLQKQYKLQLEHIEAQIPSHEMTVMQSIGFAVAPEPKRKYVTFMSMLNHPFSRGSIHINSSDPLKRPVIDPHAFEEEYDIRSFVESVKFTRRLVQQEPLKSILKGMSSVYLEEERFPGPSVQTDEEIMNFLKDYASTTFHTIGSCSMLPKEDGGVVDSKLKVYGTTNVRVMDISIIPLHIAAHTQAIAYAIGELGADIIEGLVDF